MARWKLDEAHYLNSPGTSWEQKEVDRMTGKQVRKVYPVPLHLDPNNEADWTHNVDSEDIPGGGIMVCWEGKGKPRDIIFIGDPTPAMTPMDEEARIEHAKHKWKDPIKEFDVGMTYSEKLLVDLQGQVADALTKGRGFSGGGDNSELVAIQKSMSETMAAMTQVLQQLASAPRRF